MPESNHAIMPTYGRLPVTFSHGEGAVLYDTDGRAYLDGVSGIAVTNLGHNHPGVTAAVTEQASRLVHTSNLFHIRLQERVAEMLSEATGMDNMFFCNSGAEANEAAIKLARRYGDRKGIAQPKMIVLEGAFHGRTIGALSATGNAKIRQGFGPLLEGFVRVPANDVPAIEQLGEPLADVVAVMVEPIQGEGGIKPLAPDYLKSLRNMCTANDWLLIFDEVQTGNGRCGSTYLFEQLAVVPDVLLTAKGLGNGLPIGVCMARGAAAQQLGPGDHGSTYGGNPLCCAAAVAVLTALKEDNLMPQAEILRHHLIESLKQRITDPTLIADIRGRGLMIGIQPSTSTDSIVKRGLERGLLLNIAGGDTIRVLPPLIMSREQAGELGSGIADVLNEIAEQEPL
ncbi:MAG: aspartate aminotransferase family protein [Halieaceae bacterium]|jgi:acetylornithine/N-succinyldiaminopimelate aminotransferase|nr:aspartate aminotransferase family protein [Halieaceae bacterium]